MLGALVHYGRRTGSSHVGQAGLQYALFMGVMGFIFRGVDNAAHLGGFLGGYLASLILDPLKPERIDHIADRGRMPRRDAGCDHLHRPSRAAVSPLVIHAVGFRLRTIEEWRRLFADAFITVGDETHRAWDEHTPARRVDAARTNVRPTSTGHLLCS